MPAEQRPFERAEQTVGGVLEQAQVGDAGDDVDEFLIFDDEGAAVVADQQELVIGNEGATDRFPRRGRSRRRRQCPRRGQYNGQLRRA